MFLNYSMCVGGALSSNCPIQARIQPATFLGQSKSLEAGHPTKVSNALIKVWKPLKDNGDLGTPRGAR